jgi:hypothetical protein
MEKESYDPYYRDFPSNVVPIRTPFTRPGRHDAGHVFIYMTNKWKRWSVLLDETRVNGVYEEARQRIPGGLSQFWLLEKRYSTHKPRSRRSAGDRGRGNAPPDHNDPSVKLGYRIQPDQVLVVLKEPSRSDTLEGDVISYHFTEADAIRAAETYTRRHDRRAIVGLLLWDTIWL